MKILQYPHYKLTKPSAPRTYKNSLKIAGDLREAVARVAQAIAGGSK